MRAVLFFDLPRDTASQRRSATIFVKNLIKDGFIMLQESVYVKLAINIGGIDAIKAHIEKYKPKEGSVIMLTVTEKQFGNMDIILGEIDKKTVNNTDRVIFI